MRITYTSEKSSIFRKPIWISLPAEEAAAGAENTDKVDESTNIIPAADFDFRILTEFKSFVIYF